MKTDRDGDLIKYRLRKEAQLSLADIAKRTNRTPGAVSMAIHGQTDSKLILGEIATALAEDPGTLWPDVFVECTVKSAEGET